MKHIFYPFCLGILLLFQGQLLAQQQVSLSYESDFQREDISIPGVKNFQLIKMDENDSTQIAEAAVLGAELIFTFGLNQEKEARFFINEHDALTSYRSQQDVRTFRGWSKRNESISLTLGPDFVYGFFDSQGERYNIEPAEYYGGQKNQGFFVMYKSSDVKFETPGTCGFEESKHRLEALTQEPAERRLGQCYGVEMAIASDFAMFQKYGSVADVEMRNIGVMNNVQTNYVGSFDDDIEFQIIRQFVSDCNTCDPWTSSTNSEDLLNDFTSWGNNNGFGTTDFDVGQHWSDRNFDGSTIGLAWVGGLCGNVRYHVLQDFSSNADLLRVLTAHELGHNFNGTHDADNSPHIMAPSVQNTASWSSNSMTQLSNFIAFRAGQGCFSACNGGGGGNPPVADFTVYESDLCEGSTVNFYDLSSNNPISWTWSFNGGNPGVSVEQHPSVKYDFPGTYSVELTVTNADGSDSQFKSGYITVGSGSNDIILYEDFDNGFGLWSIDNPDNGNAWELESVGGTISGAMTAKFDNVSSFNVGARDGLISPVFSLVGHTISTLNIEYAYSRPVPLGQDSLVIQISEDGGANFQRVAGFAENGTNNFATAASVNGAFTPTNRNDWCSDGLNACLQVDLSQYVGKSNLVLKIENVTGNGNNLYLDRVAVVADCYELNPPDADFSSNVQTGCIPFTVQFMDESINSPNSWNWTFTGAQTVASNMQNPSVIYDIPGQYEVILVASNDAGADAESKLDYINALSAPIVDFGFTVDGYQVVFTNTTLFGDSYLWDFGDGNTSDIEQPTHTYDGPGVYTVVLTVMNSCGSQTTTKTIEINSSLQASFAADTSNGCVPLTVTFESNSLNATSWNWIFENGTPSTSTDENPVVTYNDEGTFDVTLVVSDGVSFDTLSELNFIQTTAGPTGDFTFDRNELEVTFSANVTGQDFVSWDFGDGSNHSTELNPVHTYVSAGAYQVELEFGNACDTVSITKEVFVFEIPMPTYTTNVSAVCIGDEVSFTAQPTGDSLTYEWVFEGGTPNVSSNQNPQVTYNESGAFIVELRITSPAGTGEADASFIVVTPNTEANFDVLYQAGDSIHLEENAIEQDTFFWFLDDAYISSERNLKLKEIPAGSHEVCLISVNSCNADTSCLQFTSVPSATFNIREAGMTIFPNPSGGTFVITSKMNNESLALELFDSKGKLVDAQRLQMEQGKASFETDVESGVYFLSLDIDGKRYIEKLVVLK